MPTTKKKKEPAGNKEPVTKKKTTNTRTAKKAKRESFSTWEGHTLTPQEAKFIDEYCVTGNGRQSALTAYPEQNPKTAAQKAQELLNKNYITSEINHRLEQSRAESIASATEIMNFFSSVMRGEVKDQFGLEAPLSERTRAAVELAKRQIDIPQKLANNEQPTIRIALDWGRGATAEVAPKTVRELMGGDMTEEEINGYEGNTSTD